MFYNLPRTPYIKTRVQPRVLYNGFEKYNTKIVKVQNTYEYYHYLQKKKEYSDQQKELLEGLKIDNDDMKKLSYSVKCFGVSNKEGKFGVQSQRKFMGGSFESQSPYEVNIQSERISYPFKSKRLITSRRQQRDKQKPLSEIIKLPDRPETVRTEQVSNVDRIVKKSRLKFRQQHSQPQPQIAFDKTKAKYQSYSRLLSEAHSHESFYKILSP
ncbi:unnamed protein product [Paramecium sonneborni]|uniref:Uncharacterized protein n=1 Tax=Paramecium sonneborni TaxID=65129 RepID=A0A8S1QT87_9CILI|nr:unnamed protein product [Paramecium sonneborni]